MKHSFGMGTELQNALRQTMKKQNMLSQAAAIMRKQNMLSQASAVIRQQIKSLYQ